MEQKTENTMIENLYKNTGKPLEHWVEIVKERKSVKHSEMVNYLKDTYQLGTFYADLVVHKANGTDAGSSSEAVLLEMQYKGKEHLKPLYDRLIAIIQNFGDDVGIAPKKAYVSLRRKKQFACLKPATKARFELELIIKGQEAQGVLQTLSGAGAMCTHKINIMTEADINDEVKGWLHLAYTKAI